MTLLFNDNDIVLFQGDSITDAGRSRENDADMGHGYAARCTAWFAALHPDVNVKFLNRGNLQRFFVGKMTEADQHEPELRAPVSKVIIGNYRIAAETV